MSKGLGGFESLRTRPPVPSGDPTPEARRCSQCGAVLRRSNPGPLCAPCGGVRLPEDLPDAVLELVELDPRRAEAIGKLLRRNP